MLQGAVTVKLTVMGRLTSGGMFNSTHSSALRARCNYCEKQLRILQHDSRSIAKVFAMEKHCLSTAVLLQTVYDMLFKMGNEHSLAVEKLYTSYSQLKEY